MPDSAPIMLDGTSDDTWTVVGPRQNGPDSRNTFANAVQKSVRAALQEDRCKQEVIISGATEEGKNDLKLIHDLCQKIDFTSKPSDTVRLGKKKDSAERPRLLKVTFSTSFEARAFMARYNQARRDDSEVPRLRLRSGKSKEEWEAFKKMPCWLLN